MLSCAPRVPSVHICCVWHNSYVWAMFLCFGTCLVLDIFAPALMPVMMVADACAACYCTMVSLANAQIPACMANRVDYPVENVPALWPVRPALVCST